MSESHFDISLIVTAHEEGRLLHATMESALDAICCARDSGLSAQLLLVQDSPNSETKVYCSQLPEGAAEVLEVDFRDPGLARNAGVRKSKGDFIAFLDGDDLIGRTFLSDAHRFVQGDSRSLILHPELVVYFEAGIDAWRPIDQDDVSFSPEVLLEHNLWPAISFSARTTYEAVPFRTSDSEHGFGFEDWLFNCDTVARGFIHKLVPNTLLCVRRKSSLNSRLRESLDNRLVMNASTLFSPSWLEEAKIRN